jgi:hypothetical protein
MKDRTLKIVMYLAGAIFLLSIILFIIFGITGSEEITFRLIPSISLGSTIFITILVYQNHEAKDIRKKLSNLIPPIKHTK